MTDTTGEWAPVTPKVNRVPEDWEPMNPKGSAKSTPCATCPFRTSNFGRVTGQGEEWDTFFTARTREKVWRGSWDPEHPEAALRHGGLNHCHMTHARPCAGTMVLQQREVLREHALGTPHVIRLSRWVLSEMGLQIVAGRMFGQDRVSVAELLRMSRRRLVAAAHPAVGDLAVGHHCLAPPSEAEQRAWRKP